MLEFDRLREVGLNVIAGCPVKDLPGDLACLLPLAEIPGAGGMHLVLLGHGGRQLWESLPKPLAAGHPIDDFAIGKMNWFLRDILHDENGIVLFPDRRWLIPLQRLGRFLNVARPSWLGLDLNSDFGPWFAYRGVFLTTKDPNLARALDFRSPCETCADKPCLTACPVQAPGPTFNLPACADFRLRESSPCVDRCLARLACPYQSQHRYSEEQLGYHMARPAHLRRLSASRRR